MAEPTLPVDLPEQRELKKGDYCIDLAIERGPLLSVRLSKLQAKAAYEAIRIAHEQDNRWVEIEHDVGTTLINPDAVLSVTIRLWEEEPKPMMASAEQSSGVIGSIGPGGRRPH